MPGPIANPRIILLYGATTVAAGPAIGIQGDANLLAGHRTMPIPCEFVFNMPSGTSATVLIQTDSAIAFGTAATWTTLTFSTTIRTRRFVGRLTNIFVRANVTAVNGGTIYGTMKIGV